MAVTRETVLEALDRGMQEKSWSKRKLAEEAGYSYSGLIDFYRGKVHLPRGDALFNLLNAIDALHILTGERPRPGAEPGLAENPAAPGYEASRPAQHAPVRIRDLRRRAARWDDEATLVDTHSYSLSWLREQGAADPSALDIVFHTGSSNEPYYLDSDRLLIDRGQTALIEGEFFAFEYEGRLLIRRPQLMPGTGRIRLLCDNEAYVPVELDMEALQVVGMVIGMQRPSGRGRR